MRRMDQYSDDSRKPRLSREDMNQELYQNIGKNTRYASIADVTNTNSYDLSSLRDIKSYNRENYQYAQEYSSLVPTSVEPKKQSYMEAIKERENKVYDINSFLQEARNSREKDVQEERRKLKNDKYNILLELSKEELEEYKRKRKMRYTHPDEEKLHDVIDKITEKTLSGEIDKETTVDLLSELMATSYVDRVKGNGQELEKTFITEKIKPNEYHEEVKYEEEYKEPSYAEILARRQKELAEDTITNLPKRDEIIKVSFDEDNNMEKTIEQEEDFFTTKIDLDDSLMDDEFVEKPLPFALKLFIALLVIGILAASAYYIYFYVLN